jgi:hypothetical protein
MFTFQVLSQAMNHYEVASKQSLALAYSSTPKMEVTCSSETSVDFNLIGRHSIPEDGIHQDIHFLPLSFMFFWPTAMFQ